MVEHVHVHSSCDKIAYVAHLDCALLLDEPASNHGAHLSVAQIRVSDAHLALHRLLHLQTLESPEEELTTAPPLEHVLTSQQHRDVNRDGLNEDIMSFLR